MKFILTNYILQISLVLQVGSLSLPKVQAFAAIQPNIWGPKRTSSSSRDKICLSSSTVQATDSSGLDSGNEEEEHDDHQHTSLKTMDILSLDSIRSTLIRQEETIIFALIERSQFLQNRIIYEKGGFGELPKIPPGSSDPGDDVTAEELSFLEYLLIGTEALHCSVRRYTSPTENAFFPERLPPGPLKNLPQLDFPQDLLSSKGGASDVNFNQVLLKRYITEVVPSITRAGDDEQHGSSVLADITALQALSSRTHYGKFVAESKYRSDPEGYQKLVDDGDVEGVWNLLTNMEVEKKVLRRARLKAATYGRDPLVFNVPEGQGDSDVASIVATSAAAAVVASMEAMDYDGSKKSSKQPSSKIDPVVIENIYKNVIIPLTKEIEVAYLFRRCGREPPEHLSPFDESKLI